MPLASDTLLPPAVEMLHALGERTWAREFYLAGSAALALHLGHRPVRDLDLMSSSSRLQSSERRDVLEDLLGLDRSCRVETARDGYLFVRTGGGVATRLYYYPYPQVGNAAALGGLAVASLVDLGLMKLGAIISRGSRRDFADLYVLCRRLPLDELLSRSAEKFPQVRDFPLQALKGLADLSLTAGEPLPRFSTPLEWPDVEAWARSEVRRLGRRTVGLDAESSR